MLGRRYEGGVSGGSLVPQSHVRKVGLVPKYSKLGQRSLKYSGHQTHLSNVGLGEIRDTRRINYMVQHLVALAPVL